jgi:crotonobetaine/carnitine-CoA ligase
MVQNIARERVMHKLLERQTAKYGKRTYIYYEDQEISFKELNDQANRISSGMQKLGVAKGDKVAVVMDSCPELIYVMFGVSKLGGVNVPVNTSHKGDVMTYMVDHSDASILVMHSHFIDRLGTVLQNTPKVKAVVVLQGDSDTSAALAVKQIGAIGKQVIKWSEFIDNDGSYQPEDVKWSDPMLMLYTSGTTGLSKGVLIPHNLLYSMAERFYKYVLEGDLNENDCIYTPIPIFHAHAWHAGISLTLLSGARMVLKKRFSASANWDDIKRYGCRYTNGFGAINSILLLAEPQANDIDNPLQIVIGGPASKSVCEKFEARFGAKIMEFYGSSELSAPTLNTISACKQGSCGKVHPDFEIRLVDEDGVEVRKGEIGEILVRPLKPFIMMLEYYKMPEKNVEVWRDCWFHTGDRGRFDEDGYLFFADRKKDALRLRGENISTFEVENIINSHPAVRECAVYGVPSALEDSEDVMVSLSLKPGCSLSNEELMAFCEERMAYFMVPSYVRFMDELPKNAVLRVEKFKLREEGITLDTWDREKSGYKVKR